VATTAPTVVVVGWIVWKASGYAGQQRARRWRLGRAVRTAGITGTTGISVIKTIGRKRMPKDIASVKVLVFDVGGTVFDWHGSIREEVAALAEERSVQCDPSAVAIDWRRRMFVLLEQMRAGQLQRTNADGLHRLALDEVLSRYPQLDLTPDERDGLNDVWHKLKVWPDFPEALVKLRASYTVIVLTVLSWAIVVDSSKRRGLLWDGILSCEFLSDYKPAREAYLSATRLLRVRPDQAMMVAAHPGDLRAASEVGYQTAFVARDELGPERSEARAITPFGDAPSEGHFDISVRDFGDLAAALC
jgi:2-haloacid dehalogenase